MLQALTTESREQKQASRTVEQPEPRRELHPFAPDGAFEPAPQLPNSGPHGHAVSLQSAVGNQAVLRMISSPRPRVQTKLTVNQRGDRYEQEADRVAEQVMRMPGSAGGAAGSAEPAAEPRIQRKCKECEEEQKKVQRKCKACEDEEKKVQRSARPSAGGAPPAQISESALSSGGESLPEGVRGFYEPRFGRDFSGVRVHTGPASERYNESLRAYAFTYGNHVWLGGGQALKPSLLLAHELAHVVQQNRPAAIAPKEKLPAQAQLYDPQPVIRRFEPYWEPPGVTGTTTHNEVLPRLGADNANQDLFTEAPVANARNAEGDNMGELADFGHIGYADLYKASPSTTVGAYFLKHATPAATPNKGVQKGGVSFDHASRSRPQVTGGALSGSADAPTSIKIGDLKPNSGLKVLVGWYQLQGYKEGYTKARTEAQDPATPGDGRSWSALTVSFLGPDDLKIPDQYTFPNFQGQTPQNLVIKQALHKDERPTTPVSGHLCIRPHANVQGIWVYAWVPTNIPAVAQLPPRIRALAPVLQQRIIDPLLQSPVEVRKKSKQDEEEPKAIAIPSSSDPSPVIRRKEIEAPEKDNFDYDEWKKSLKKVTDEYNEDRATPEFKSAEASVMANRAHEHLRTSMGLPLADLGEGKETAHTLSKVEFWTGKSAMPFGFFRHVFGGVFVKVAQFFVKVRDKVRGFLKKMKTKTTPGAGFVGAALRAAFKGLKLIAGFVVGKIADRLMQALIRGVAKKLKAFVGDEAMEQLEAKAQEVNALAEKIEKKATDTADALLEKTIGVHLKDLEKLQDVYNIFSDIVTLVNLVRWGARVIACLSPPAVGCLWILAEGALDFAAQKVAETCWFQEKIRPLLESVNYIKTELPNKLADGLIAKVKEFLPEPIADVLEIEENTVTPGEGELECDEDDDHTQYVESPLHKQIDEMYQKIGPERAAALQEIARKMKAPKDQALTADDISRLGDALQKVDPAKLAAYAKAYPAGTDGVPGDLTTALNDIENPAAAAQTGAPQATSDQPPADANANVDQMQTGTDPQGDQGGEPGKDEQGGGQGGVPVVEASQHRTSEKKAGDIPDATVEILNIDVANHVAGAKPLIHVVVFLKGKAVMIVRNIETTVVRRAYIPEGSTPDDALAFAIYYQVKYGVKVTAVPNGGIEQGRVLPGLIYTVKGRQTLDAVAKQNSASPARK